MPLTVDRQLRDDEAIAYLLPTAVVVLVEVLSTDANQPIIIELQRASTLIFFSAKRREKILLIPKMGRRPIAKSVVFF